MGKRPMLPITRDEYGDYLDVCLEDYGIDVPVEVEKQLFDAASKGDQASLDKLLLAGIRKGWDTFWRDAQKEKREWLRVEAEERRHEEQEKKRLAELEFKRAMPEILRLIQEKKLTVTAEFMKSIKDPQLKRKIVEATCLSQV